MTKSTLHFAVANLAALALASGMLFAGAAKAQDRGPMPTMAGGPGQPFSASAGQTVRVDLGGPVGASRSLALPRGKSAVIELPVDAHDVLVSDPKVANVVLSTPRRIYVMGVAAGETDAVFVDASGRQILRLNVRVDQDISALSQTLNRILPGSTLHAEALNDNLVLSGEVPSAADADRAMRLAASFVAKPEQIVNMISVAQPEQVMLKVRIVEVNRSVVKQLGVNLSALMGQVGLSQFSLANAASYAVNGALLGGVSAGYSVDTTAPATMTVPCAAGLTGTCTQIIHPGNNYYTDANGVRHLISNSGTATTGSTVGSNGLNKADAMIQAFEQVGLIRTLAEPNLTAVSGESAKFLAGGEFPVPIGEDSTGRITVEFKQFGVGLGFTPVVLSKGLISLKISTEYSELTNVGALNQASTTSTTTPSSGTGSSTTTSPGFTVPGLTVRRAETMVELPSGGAMMIAGLLQSVTKEDLSSLPGLMQLPVLGSLFRSRDYQQQETELVVIVTPYLVKSVRPDQIQTPADGLQMADDVATDLLGQLNKGFNKPAAPPVGQTYQGSFGYVVE
jgi:pilus assembly protein CpaC